MFKKIYFLFDFDLETFRSMFDRFSIEYTTYIRTTEQRHCQTVQYVWNELLKKNLIYKGSYEGWYSVPDECFVSEDEVRFRLVSGFVFQFLEKIFLFFFTNGTIRL